MRGVPGIGKSHVASATAGVFVEKGGTAKLINVPDFLSELRKAINREGDSIDNQREMFAGVGLLCLDDFGAERPTQWTTEQMYQVVDARYRQRLPLLVTTNARHIDPRVESRLSSGLVEIRATDRRREFD